MNTYVINYLQLDNVFRTWKWQISYWSQRTIHDMTYPDPYPAGKAHSAMPNYIGYNQLRYKLNETKDIERIDIVSQLERKSPLHSKPKKWIQPLNAYRYTKGEKELIFLFPESMLMGGERIKFSKKFSNYFPLVFIFTESSHAWRKLNWRSAYESFKSARRLNSISDILPISA